MKTNRLIQLMLHYFIGVGGMAGGFGAISNPMSPMGMSTDYLKFSPFSSYLIPGLLLFFVIGVGHLFAAVILQKKLSIAPYSSGIAGGALVIWIVVQCIMLQAVAVLHAIFFVLGSIEGLLALIVLYKKKLFPMNLLSKTILK